MSLSVADQVQCLCAAVLCCQIIKGAATVMDKKSVTTLTLKQINKHTVYQYIYRQRETSKFQIVQDLNMGLSTVSQNLTTLEKEGLIERNGLKL